MHEIHLKKKQTTIECFLDSVKKKLEQPMELEVVKKTPVRKVMKVPMMKESGEKRKKTVLPVPSSGNIKKYFTIEGKKTKNDDVINEEGVSNNDTNTTTNDVENPGAVLDEVRKTVVDDEKAPLHVQPAVKNIVKKTFRAVVGGGGNSVKDTIRKHEALMKKCEFGNGRCMTHYVKLERNVKKKKYSVVNSNGNIDWKYRDVTCLVCPSQKSRGLVNVGDDELPGAAGNKKLSRLKLF